MWRKMEAYSIFMNRKDGTHRFVFGDAEITAYWPSSKDIIGEATGYEAMG